MNVIPVIDIKNHNVVHAKQGQRHLYQPINSNLCPDSNAHQMIKNLLLLDDFKIIYIADLDAIMNSGHNNDLIESCCNDFPSVNFWVDHGERNYFNGSRPLNCRPVIGSENLSNQDLSQLSAENRSWVLSLDHNQYGAIGPDQLFKNQNYWPKEVILMTLNKVGAANGPDWGLIKQYRNHYPKQNFIAAGGIRDIEDLLALHELGLSEALIASALHNQKIAIEELKILKTLTS